MFKNKILLIITIIAYIDIGVLALIFHNADIITSKYFIGGAIIVSNLPIVLVYLAHEYYREYSKIPYMVFVLGSIVIGVLFILSNSISLPAMCITWGAFDIARALYEAYDAATEFKGNKFELIEIAVAIGEIVFGILLIIHLSHGIPVHLIYLGISSFLIAIKYSIDIIRKESH